ncbi:MAG: LamG-like jellyroll fold domain-containing protein, partial [bacterium]
SALASNTWTHLALSFSGTTGTLYVAGAQVNQSTNLTCNPDQLHAPLMEDANYIGRGNTGGYFAGRIDEFRVYNRALTSGEVATVKGEVTAGAAPGADTAAPTPSPPTWLVTPTLAGDSAITMSANPGTDANGVLYYFRCTNDSTHDSGWISENTYTDCKVAPGTSYTFAVRMKDARGNTTSESSSQSATAAATDTAAPTPNPPTFSSAPKGVSTTDVSMTATAGNDADATVMYKFSRAGSAVNSGWTSSRIWTDTGLTPGSSYTYTLQMKDGHGNTTAETTSAAAVARDDTPPALDADFRLQWDTYPYVQLDKTVRMYARPQDETAVQYYYECVEQPAVNSGWITHPADAAKTPTWITPPLTNGTYSFRFRLRDTSPQANMSSWSAVKAATVTSNNTYSSCSLSQLAGLADSTLVVFTGKVVQVSSTCYVVTNGTASIQVTPRTYASKTDRALLNQSVMVKGHLWTYTGTPKRVTFATVSGNPQTGKVEFEDCDSYDERARLLYDAGASGSEYLGWHQPGWAVSVSNVAAATQLSLAYAGGGGALSLYLNGSHYRNVTLPGTANNSTWGATTVTGLSIPSGATLTFQQDAGDTAPNLDYMILGPAYVLSGKVANTNGVGIAGAAVYVSDVPGAAVDPTYSTVTDASGNYAKTVPNGTWYVAAAANALAYVTSADQTVVVNGANVSNINFALQPITRSFPRMSDLLFCCIPEMLPDAGAAGKWFAYAPTNMSFGIRGSPTVETLSDVKWEKNSYAAGDGFLSTNYSSPIAINGATIVVAVKPARNTTYGYQYAVVNAFFDRLSVGIENPTGRVYVKCNGNDTYGPAIPDGQVTVLSLVVQPAGQYKVYANGAEIMSNATASDMTSLVPNVPGGYANTLSIGNNGPDGASSFNGNIGDVCFYKVALADAERQALEANMTTQFAGPTYAIAASAGTGGTISPNGALVSPGTNQTFTISPLAGYVIADVTVDGVSQGAVGSYTFTHVVANHTIAATFTAVANTPPAISNVADQTIDEDHATSALAFTVSDAETPAASLTVTRSSSNTLLVPDVNIVIGGSGTNRTVTVTPLPNQNGSATITLTVSDGVLTATDTFVLTVNAVNDAPVISAIADQSVNTNQPAGPIAFTVSDAETPAASLTVTGYSSNTVLVPDANIVLGGGGGNRTVTVTPASGQTGTATITLTVSDGLLNANETFVLTVAGVVTAGWTGNGANNNWSTAANWNPVYVSGSSSDIVFSGTAARLTSNNDGASDANSVGNVTFNSGAAAYTLSGNRFNLYGDIANDSASKQTFSITPNLGGRSVSVSGSGSLDFANLYSSVVGAKFAKVGSGAVQVKPTSDLTFKGAFRVEAGTLTLDRTSALVFNSLSSLEMAGGQVTYTVSGAPSADTAVGTSLAAGTSSKIYVTQGTSSRAKVSFGALSRTEGATLLFAYSRQDRSAMTVATDNTDYTAAGGKQSILGGAYVLQNENIASEFAFAYRLAGDRATGGTLLPNQLQALGWTGTPYSTTFAAAADVDLPSGSSASSGAVTVNSLRFTTSGAATVDLSAGDITIASGGLLTTPNVGANAVTISSGHLTSAQTELFVHQYNTGAGTRTMTINSVITDNPGSVALVKAGGGVLVLGGANSFTGKTYINTGSLLVSNALALQNSTLIFNAAGAGTLQFGSGLTSATLGGLEGSRDVSLLNQAGTPAPVALAVGKNGTTTLYSGALSGSGASLTKIGAGTLVLTGTNTYTGATLVSNGTLLVNGSLAAGSDVTVSTNATLGGTGTVSGSVNSQGTLAPGASVGTLIAGAVTLRADSKLEIEFSDWAASAPGTGWDLLTCASLALGGTPADPVVLKLLPLGLANFSESAKTFTIAASAASISGFATNAISINPGAMSGTGTWSVKLDGTGKLLQLVYTPAGTDALAVWQAEHFTPEQIASGQAGPDADPDGDGRSNLAEFAFNGDPDSKTNSGLFATRLADGGDAGLEPELAFTFAARRGAVFAPDASRAQVSASIDGLVYTVSGSILLGGTWDSEVSHVGVSDTAPSGSSLPALYETGWQYHTFSGFNGLPGTGFLRVQVTQP